MNRNPDLNALELRFGIMLPTVQDFLPDLSAGLAMDAQAQLVTVSNSGIPAFLTNYMDPKVIEVITAPNKGAKLIGEARKGDWITRTMTFPMVESTGETSSYGDWNNNGSTNANTQFPERQSYHFQTITQWGEKQLAEAGLAKIDWASRLNIASTMVLDKFLNNSYFFGVGGLRCYGLLNDPSLPAALTPVTKAATGTTWAVATASEVYLDIQKLFGDLIARTQGLVDAETRMVLVTSPGIALYLTNTNIYNVNVYDQLKKNFPNIRFESAPQYATLAGNVIQLIAEEVEGQEVGYCAFTEKLRAHPIIPDLSAFKQKKSSGTWGAIVFLPGAISQMIGV